MNSLTGQLLALITAACWAQNSIVYAAAGKRVGSTTVTHVRLWISLPAIILVHLLMTGSVIPPGLQLRETILLFVSGLCSYCVADLFIFRAFVDLGPRNTLVVLTLSPIFSTVISWFTLGERLSLLEILGIVTTVLGVIWVVESERRDPKNEGKRHSGMGLLCAFMGSVIQAVALVLAKAALAKDVHPVSANLVRIFAGLVGLVIFAAVRRKVVSDFLRMKDRRALLYIAIGAIVGPVFGVLMNMYALSMAPVGIVTALGQISPVMLLPVERFVFKTRVSWGAAAGTVVAIGGTLMLFLF